MIEFPLVTSKFIHPYIYIYKSQNWWGNPCILGWKPWCHVDCPLNQSIYSGIFRGYHQFGSFKLKICSSLGIIIPYRHWLSGNQHLIVSKWARKFSKIKNCLFPLGVSWYRWSDRSDGPALDWCDIAFGLCSKMATSPRSRKLHEFVCRFDRMTPWGWLKIRYPESPNLMVNNHSGTRRRMARERRGAGSSLVSMETQF